MERRLTDCSVGLHGCRCSRNNSCARARRVVAWFMAMASESVDLTCVPRPIRTSGRVSIDRQPRDAFELGRGWGRADLFRGYYVVFVLNYVRCGVLMQEK